MKPGRIGFRKLLFLFPLVIFFFCISTGVHAANGGTRVRIIHLAPISNEVEVWVEGRLIDQDLEFGENTDYIELVPGDNRIICKTVESGNSIVLNTLFPFREDRDYTLAITGRARSDLQLTTTIDSCPPSESLSQLKFTNAITGTPPLDVSIKYGPTLYEKLAFRTSGGCRLVPPDEYVLKLTEARTGKLVAEKEIDLKGGTRYNLFAADNGEQDDIRLLGFEQENRPKQEPKILGVERSVLQLLGAGLIASVLILVLGQ
uniref:DUF4397 domain-containing protein n=1 Tax=uncultured organism TaxID=155900 RepID=M1PUZ6_9ZZZZ|nr:conserved hypothetical protein, secreted [uncultured organism]